MRLTIAICTWNRSALLRQTLEQLTRVSIPADLWLEVLVVNNNCTDATDAVIDEFSARLPVRRIFEGTPGLAHARNAALAQALGDYIAYTDDDVLVDEAWLTEFVAATRAFPGAAAIGGIIAPWFPKEPDPDLIEVFDGLRMGFCGLDHQRDACVLPDRLFIWGANMAFRREAIAELRFNPSLGVTPNSAAGGEEIDLLRRLRAARESVVWWPTMRVKHYVDPSRMTREYLFKYVAGKGAERVHMPARLQPTGGADLHAGSGTFAGAPRWLWRRYALVYLRYLLSFVTPAESSAVRLFSGDLRPNAPRRIRTLVWRREVMMLGGMIEGYRKEASSSSGDAGKRPAASGTRSQPGGPTSMPISAPPTRDVEDCTSGVTKSSKGLTSAPTAEPHAHFLC